MSLNNTSSTEAQKAETPFVGIAMATYNPCLSYLIDQVSSLRNQTFKNWKCVIVDDNSSEQKFQNILAIIGNDERFEIHRNGSNLGSFKTFERALSLLPENVNYVCFCDQDDVWVSTKLEIQLKSFENPFVYLVHTDQSLIDEKGRVFVASCWTLEGRSVLEATTDLLLFRNLITGCTAMFRREVLSAALPFYRLRPLPEMYHHDMWIAMHACVKGTVLGLNEPLVLYRQHGSNLVGVSSLRRNVKIMERVSRARLAFNERLAMREDFLDSLERAKSEGLESEVKRLSFLDHPSELAITGFKFVLNHPQFLRTWIMLWVGLVTLRIKKTSLAAQKVH